MGYGKRDVSRLGSAAQQQILQKMNNRGGGKGETELQEIRFVIPLNPVTKKNSQRIVKCGRYRKLIPSEAYERYEEDAKPFLPGRGLKLNRPCEVMALFYMKTRRKVDLTNLLEALDDTLVKHEVLEDDNSKIIVSHDGSRVLHDPKNPRTEVMIRFLDGGKRHEPVGKHGLDESGGNAGV